MSKPQPFTSDLIGCARCHGEGHENITWQPLTFPVPDTDGTEWTHWAPCPTNGEPILMRIQQVDREDC